MPICLNANISLFLVPLLVVMPVWAQSDTAVPIQTAGVLQLKVADSDGAQIPVNSPSGKGYVVVVTDAYGVPAPDAAVVLRLPDSGPTGLFADGSHAAVAYTDAGGQAHFSGIHWTGASGPMPVRLTATKGSAHAGLLVEQSLVSGAALAAVPAPRIQAPVMQSNLASPAAAATAEEPVELNTIAASAETATSVRPAIRVASVEPGVSVINNGKTASLLRSANPSVAVSNDGFGPAYHGSKKKWIILGIAVIAAAGAAFAIASMSKAGSSAAASSPISIGAPTVSVGHP